MKKLFTPVKIGKLELLNRIVMTAMQLNYSNDGFCTQRLIDFYRERARGGVGLIIIGGCVIDEYAGGRIMIGLDDDKFIPGLRELASAVHEYGAKIACQLYHGGSYVHSMLIDGRQAVSASPVMSGFTKEVPRKLSISEIKEIIKNYGKAARKVKDAGFDGVEVLAGTGYLISQFLSPVTNKRKDRYGGDFTSRMRFGLEVAREVRKTVGPDFPVIFRVAGNEFVPGGNTNKEARIFCQGLEKAGVDAINVTGGWHETRVPQITMAVPRGAFVYLAQGIKEVVGIPVIACNRINDPIFADQILRDGMADLIGIGRPLIADPELPNKAKAGRFDEIRTCIACNQGCFDRVFELKPITCLQNPRAGREGEFEVKPAKKPKRVMVVGGGPGGMETAYISALRGHDVSLYEREDRLGGQIYLCAIPPGRGDFFNLLGNLNSQLRSSGVKVELDTEVTPELVEEVKPDVVVVATGARPIIPDIPGIDGQNVVGAWDLLYGKVDVGDRVVIVGGGAVGCETALFLANKGTLDGNTLHFLAANRAEDWETLNSLTSKGIKKVTIVEMLPRLGRDIGLSTRWTIMQELRRFGVEMIKNTPVKEILADGVIFERDGKDQKVEADSVVIAVGSRSENALYEKLKDKGREVYLIGDSKEPRKILEAIQEGFEVGFKV